MPIGASFFIFNAMINFKGKLCNKAPLVMGILNITNDSFYDGGKYINNDTILQRAEQIINRRGDIIDIGAMSTRPGSLEIPEHEEIDKIKNAVDLVRKNYPDAIISVDTYRAKVAEAAINSGADMINDISGGTFDNEMIPLIGRMQVPYCLMHTTAKPDTMQQNVEYEDILADMLKFFGIQIEKLRQYFVHDIIIDPGFGFGKTLQQNYYILKNLSVFQQLGFPILVGMSRKSMIYNLLKTNPNEALNGTTAVNTVALLNGASILRVHDVKEAVETCQIANALLACEL